MTKHSEPSAACREHQEEHTSFTPVNSFRPCEEAAWNLVGWPLAITNARARKNLTGSECPRCAERSTYCSRAASRGAQGTAGWRPCPYVSTCLVPDATPVRLLPGGCTAAEMVWSPLYFQVREVLNKVSHDFLSLFPIYTAFGLAKCGLPGTGSQHIIAILFSSSKKHSVSIPI